MNDLVSLYGIRDPFASELDYFKKNPTVSGMATEDNKIILNPYAKLNKEEFINKLKNDEKFLNEFGNLGPVYGKQWRKWSSIEKMIRIDEGGNVTELNKETEIDQLENIFLQLEKDPDNRRMIINSWNVSDIESMVLPPCHYSFQIYTQTIDLNKRIDIWKKSTTIDDQTLEEFNKKSNEEKHIYLVQIAIG